MISHSSGVNDNGISGLNKMRAQDVVVLQPESRVNGGLENNDTFKILTCRSSVVQPSSHPRPPRIPGTHYLIGFLVLSSVRAGSAVSKTGHHYFSN